MLAMMKESKPDIVSVSLRSITGDLGGWVAKLYLVSFYI